MATTNVTLKIEGMTCTGCEQRLGTALRRLEGVSEARADHRTGELTIRYDPDATDREALEERVVVAGYEVADTEGSA
ncbi:cation transporter [Microbacterium sp. SCN 69-37]|uniref:heavy-metal-associated domain-containing protein n=1 Tax=Microbacterium sp. SCN 69-37 TaxID=1660115 RepID=UPI0025F9E383|nr:cation transporter [Microbacterium sp. SCN 69-37]